MKKLAKTRRNKGTYIRESAGHTVGRRSRECQTVPYFQAMKLRWNWLLGKGGRLQTKMSKVRTPRLKAQKKKWGASFFRWDEKKKKCGPKQIVSRAVQSWKQRLYWTTVPSTFWERQSTKPPVDRRAREPVIPFFDKHPNAKYFGEAETLLFRHSFSEGGKNEWQ